MPHSKKRYLGDGVYIEIQNGQYVLTTENGLDATNTIYFEPEIMDQLIKYVKEVKGG